MLRFGDSEWKDLIPYIGFCNHVKAGIKTIKEENKKEALSQLHVQRMAVIRVLVLHKAVEFEPNSMGGWSARYLECRMECTYITQLVALHQSSKLWIVLQME